MTALLAMTLRIAKSLISQPVDRSPAGDGLCQRIAHPVLCSRMRIKGVGLEGERAVGSTFSGFKRFHVGKAVRIQTMYISRPPNQGQRVW